jgi:hypothetical protein
MTPKKQGISILFSRNILYLLRTQKVWNVSSPLSLSSLVEQLVDSTVICGSCRDVSRLSKVGDKIVG